MQPSVANFVRTHFTYRYRGQLIKVLYGNERWTFEDYMIVPCVFFMVRCLAASVVIAHKWWVYEDYDVLLRVVNSEHSYDHALALCLAALFFFAAYVNYFLYTAFVAGVPKVIDYFQQMNMINTEQIVRENGPLLSWVAKWDNWRQHPFEQSLRVAKFVLAIYRGDNVDQFRLTNRLADFPIMTKHNRLKVFLLYIFCEIGLTLVVFLFGFLAVGITTPYLVKFYLGQLPITLIEFPLIIVDFLIGLLSMWTLVNNAMLMMLMIWMIVYTIHLYLRQVNALFDEMWRPKFGRTRRIGLTARFWVLWHEHHRICTCIENGARQWDILMAVFLITNLVPNVYFLTFLLNQGFSKLGDALAVLGVLYGQVTISMLTILPAAYNSTMAHYAGHRFVPLQAKIRDLPMKLKWDNYHTLINTKHHKVAYTANVFGRITLFAMFQFIFVYAETIIFFTGMVKKSQNRMSQSSVEVMFA